MRSDSEIAAVLSLLDEAEPSRAEAIVARLALCSHEERQALLLPAIGASEHVKRNLEAAMVRARFAQLEGSWRELATQRRLSLEPALMLLARSGSAATDCKKASTLLDELARRTGARLSGDRAFDTGLVALRDVLMEFGLRGNEADYYNPLNTYLPSVLDRKLGIPISLASVAILVGQRLELPVHGVGTPGHFLCFYGEPTIPSGTFFDPYNGFRSVSRAQAENMIRALGNRPEPGMFSPVNEREIVARTLRNLIAHYRTHSENEHAQQLLKWLDTLITHGATP
ncbi:MAG: transglutaminase family protein [Planctomycetes bacterium]|nr:transglutaminase family protein [Planctomycetota bacterium]